MWICKLLYLKFAENLNNLNDLLKKQFSKKSVNAAEQDQSKGKFGWLCEVKSPQPQLFETHSATSDDHDKAIITENGGKIETQGMTLLVGNIDVTLLVDSGMVCSILSESLTIEVVQLSNQYH